MRKLVSIQKVNNIVPIPGADRIEMIQVLGWKCVAKKGEFKVGDKCAYFEIDSLLPQVKAFEFLANKGIKSVDIDGVTYTGYRLRTITLKGQVSQGLALPLTALSDFGDFTNLEEDFDITEQLGIVKWERALPACLSGVAKGDFPSYIPKTDETRIQVLEEVLTKFKDVPFYKTEKLDGASTTFFKFENQFGVCSRNLELVEGDSSQWQIAKKLDLVNKMPNGFAIQGELIGPGIQGNKLKGSQLEFYAFNVYDIKNAKPYGLFDMQSLLKDKGIPMVPVKEIGIYLNDMTIDKLVDISKSKSALASDVDQEGEVYRPLVPMRDLKGQGWLSFKVINPDFLIKFDE